MLNVRFKTNKIKYKIFTCILSFNWPSLLFNETIEITRLSEKNKWEILQQSRKALLKINMP